MSNGLMQTAREIIESGEIPPKVSARLQTALAIENNRLIQDIGDSIKDLASKKDLSDLEERVEVVEDDSKRWNRLTALFAVIVATIGGIFGSQN